jgi:hypothetical protein
MVSVGRRSVPPAERPNAAVRAEKRRERPRPRRANLAPRPYTGGRSRLSCPCPGRRTGASTFPGEVVSAIAPRNHDHLPASSGHRLTHATCAGFPTRTCSSSALRSAVAPVSIVRSRLGASRLPAARRRRFAVLTRPARSRWPGNYRSDGAIWTTTGLHLPGFRDASGRLQSCALTNHASRPHDRSHDVLVPSSSSGLHGGRCRVR